MNNHRFTDIWFYAQYELVSNEHEEIVLWNQRLQSFIGSKLHDDIWIKWVMIVRYTACSTRDIIVNLLAINIKHS